jgi:hypothetical protein
MESHQPQKNQDLEGLPDGQPPPPRRFRIVKLEERIAPGNKRGWFKNTKACGTFGCGPQTHEIECW